MASSLTRRGARSSIAKLAVSAFALVALAGCTAGGAGGSPTSSAPQFDTSSVPAAVAGLPASIKDAGVLTVAIPTNEPPTQFYKPGTTQLIGVNPGIARLIADALGLKLKIEVTNFDGIIPGLAAGRYDMTVSSMSPTTQRMETLDFVEYAQLGSSLGAKRGNPAHLSLDNLCGHSVALLTGSYQLSVDIPTFDAACKKAGKSAVDVLQFQDTRQAISAVLSGRAEAAYADSPIIGYAAQQNPSGFQVVQESEFAPVAVGIPHNTGLLGPVTSALKEIVKRPEYKAMLKSYGLGSMAITDVRVNVPQG